ncbi:MAG: LacI family DNA-binding transcriptional regulator [Variovorax sp.]
MQDARAIHGTSRKMTLKDVSIASGLSLVTVSRALHKPQSVQEHTRQRVQQAIDDIGYFPNLTARSLVSNRSGMVGVVVPILTSSLFADFAQGVADTLRAESMQMLLGVSQRSSEDEAEAVKTFIARQADAIIVTGFTHSSACRKHLSSFNGPIVETWNLREEKLDIAVGYDNFSAAAAMTGHLIDKGYQEIAMVGGAFENNDQAVDRRDGYVHAMRERGRPVRDEFIVSVPNPTTLENGCEAMAKLLAGPVKPDAVFFQAEIPAHGAMMFCLSHGISVPNEVAIAGFGDLTLSAMLPIPLTTVRIKARLIGETAAAMVLKRLKGDLANERVIDVGYEIMMRQSA